MPISRMDAALAHPGRVSFSLQLSRQAKPEREGASVTASRFFPLHPQRARDRGLQQAIEVLAVFPFVFLLCFGSPFLKGVFVKSLQLVKLNEFTILWNQG